MTAYVDARDHLSGKLVASLPTPVLPSIEPAHATGLSRKLRHAFVAAGQLTASQAEAVDFVIRDKDAPQPP